MKIMSVNAGSSSLKFQLLEMPQESVLVEGLVESIGSGEVGAYKIETSEGKFKKELVINNHGEAVAMMLADLVERNIISSLDEIDGVGHRVVHGGVRFTQSAVISEEVIKEIEAVIPLAPLHNPAHLTGIKAFQEALPNVFQIVVFDTAFHQTMKEDAYIYAVPYEWYQNHKVRKYGAHGTSHQFVANKCAEMMEKPIEDLKIVTLHIGNGASLSAVKGGKCVDTSMGLGPLAGIPMGTRCGTVDPTIVEYIAKMENMDIPQILNAFNKKSGYLGVSGVSHDSRAVEEAAANGNARAQLALDVQAKSIADYIGSYYVYMEGIDAIVFTAGIAENCADFRKRVLDRVKVLGVEYDEELIKIRKTQMEISTPNSKIKVFVIPTNEELAIARDVVRLKSENNK